SRASTRATSHARSPKAAYRGASTRNPGIVRVRRSPASMASLSASRTSASTYGFIPDRAPKAPPGGARVEDPGTTHGTALYRRPMATSTSACDSAPGARPSSLSVLGVGAPRRPARPPRIATRAPTPADSLRGQSPARDGRPINCDLQALRRVMALAYLVAGQPSSMPTTSLATSDGLAPSERRPLGVGRVGGIAERRQAVDRDHFATGRAHNRAGGRRPPGRPTGNPPGRPRPPARATPP